ncbi:hypothetical protein D9758_017238 [Tetrapyrgos nigripes]|uniref:Uncharacterized protein n=1 Tax=Tetrapyrgos nigripes TaxID=182062 RepID=A0A8H5FGS2_9AGAR|nr:hypothetical protein D9758_017238 [Tetrapyrgos nigripes]
MWGLALTVLISSCVVTSLEHTHPTLPTLGLSKGVAWGAVSTLLVGGLAAGAAFGLVKALEGGGEMGVGRRGGWLDVVEGVGVGDSRWGWGIAGGGGG